MLISVDEGQIRQKITWLMQQADKHFVKHGATNWATEMYVNWLGGILYVVTPDIISKEESEGIYAKMREFRASTVDTATDTFLTKLEQCSKNLTKNEGTNEQQ